MPSKQPRPEDEILFAELSESVPRQFGRTDRSNSDTGDEHGPSKPSTPDITDGAKPAQKVGEKPTIRTPG